MKYKKVTVGDINDILGIDITVESEIRARQGAWLCFFINGFTYSDIGRMFGCSESNVRKGVDRFEDLLKEGDKVTLDLWQKLKVYEL